MSLIMNPIDKLNSLQASLRKTNELILRNDIKGLKSVYSSLGPRDQPAELSQLRSQASRYETILKDNNKKLEELGSRVKESDLTPSDSLLKQFMTSRGPEKQPAAQDKQPTPSPPKNMGLPKFDFLELFVDCGEEGLEIPTSVVVKLSNISVEGQGEYPIEDIRRVQYPAGNRMLLHFNRLPSLSLIFGKESDFYRFDYQVFFTWKKAKVGRGQFFASEFGLGKELSDSIETRKRDLLESKDKFLSDKSSNLRKPTIKEVEFQRQQKVITKSIVKEIEDPAATELLFLNKYYKPDSPAKPESEEIAVAAKLQPQMPAALPGKSDTQKIETLKKGLNFIKYAKGSFKPKQKLIFLDQEEKNLCWRDPLADPKESKTLLLEEIVSVVLGRHSEGFKKFDSDKTQKELNERSVTIKGKKRILELEAQSVERLAQLAEGLEALCNKQGLTLMIPPVKIPS